MGRDISLPLSCVIKEVFIMSKRDWFWFSGVWAFFATFTLILLICSGFWVGLLKQPFHPTILGIAGFLGILVWVIVLLINTVQYYIQGKTDFNIFSSGISSASANHISKEKRAALHPPVPAKYLSKEADGLILGRKNGKYVRVPIQSNNIYHTLLLGAPGTGKSTGPLLSTLIANFKKEQPSFTAFALDIKPELAKKSVDVVGNPNVKVFSPSAISEYSWDIYYELDQFSTYDDVMDVIDQIARSLIFASDEKNQFFADSAINIFNGLMFYCYQYYHYDFMKSMQWVISANIPDAVKEALKNSKDTKYEVLVASKLSQYSGKQDATLNSIIMVLNQNLGVFSNSKLEHNFSTQEKMVSPADLDNHISVFISLPERDLEQYSGILRLVVNQTIKFFESRGDKQRVEGERDSTILMLIDEFYRLGKMDNVVQGFATLRSRGISILVATQNMSQLEEIYGQHGMKNILELCQVNVLLSAKDPNTVDIFSKMAGEYQETAVSVTKSGGILDTNSSSSTNTSKQYRPILTAQDFADLAENKSLVAFINGKYMMLEKNNYYEDPSMNEYSEQVVERNKAYFS